MKILLIASSPDTDAHHIFALLQRAGLQSPLPAASGMTVQTWHSKLYQALEQTNPHQTRQPLTIGKAWQDLAVGIHHANIDQNEWGFADPLATWTLDFWKNLDTQTRFVLVYTPAQHVDLAEPQALQTWLAYNTELLRFYKANKQRTVLLNAAHIAAHPLRLAHTCQKQLGLHQLDWQQLSQEPTIAKVQHTPPAATRKLDKQLAQACTPLLNPSTAMVATGPSAQGAKSKLSEIFGVFGKNKQLSEQLEQANKLLAELGQQKQTLEQQTQAHKQEGELLLAQLHQVQEELEKHLIANKQNQDAKTKAEADKAKAEADKNKAIADKAASDKAKAELEKAKADATQEAELLLQQLHQVQEELENYYLKNKQLEQGAQTLQITQERLGRLLARLPTWADANTLVAQLVHNQADHQALRVQAQQVWIGPNKPLPEVGLLIGVQHGQPYLQLGPTPELPQGLNTQDQAAMALLNTTQWRTLRSLLGLVPAHMGRLQNVPEKDRPFWLNTIQTLGQQFQGMANQLRYDHADPILVSTPAAGQETLRLALRNLELSNYRNPLLVLDLTLQQKTTRGKTKTTHVHFDFRQWKQGSAPFAVWKTNQQDDNGQYLRFSFDIAKQRFNQTDYAQLSPQDQAVLVALVQTMPAICEELDLRKHTLALGQDAWGAALLQAASLAEYELQTQVHESSVQTETAA
jgi:hypothetical protein